MGITDKIFNDQIDQINYDEGFNKGAHQATQETRLEIALSLIKQVANEEASAVLRDIGNDLMLEIRKIRNET